MMFAYYNNQGFKDELLSHIRAHREADEYLQGWYWESGKGCAIGCALESLRVMHGLSNITHDDHELLAEMTGIPEGLYHLQDCIFEGLTITDCMMWPERFAAAATPGADLSHVVWQFLHWFLTNEAINPGITHPIVKDVIADVASIMADTADGKIITTQAEMARRSAVAAERALWAETDMSMEEAKQPMSAVVAARLAAEAALPSPWDVWSNSARASAALAGKNSQTYTLMADKLIEMMAEVKVVTIVTNDDKK